MNPFFIGFLTMMHYYRRRNLEFFLKNFINHSSSVLIAFQTGNSL